MFMFGKKKLRFVILMVQSWIVLSSLMIRMLRLFLIVGRRRG